MDLSHYTILLVEDEEEVRQYYVMLFQDYFKCKVLEASNGQNALKVFQRGGVILS